MMFSLSSNDIIENSIQEFKEKNIVFNNGYIKNNGDDKLYAKLLKDLRLENVYQQYVIHDVQLLTSNHQEILSEKYPMPKTKETLSYGTMPRINKNEIALSPSLAKKFNSKINQLIGKEIKLKYQNHDHKLTISGIYNAGYDDFFVSSDIERQLYNNFNDEYYSISYDVKNFDDIVTVSQQMQEHNIQSENASEQVGMLQESFHKLKTIFYLISIMILFVAIFIVIVILLKLQNKRYQMIGLLYSFGFEKQIINQLVIFENFWLILLTGVITTLLVIISQILAPTINLSINFTLSKYLITIITSIVIMVVINFIISRKLINTNLAEALRK